MAYSNGSTPKMRRYHSERPIIRPARQTAPHPYAGAAIGEVAPWMVGVGELRAAGLLPKVAATGSRVLAKKGALLAAEGGAMGAAQPVTEGGSYGAQKALQTGIGAAAAPAIGGTLAGAWEACRAVQVRHRRRAGADRQQPPCQALRDAAGSAGKATAGYRHPRLPVDPGAGHRVAGSGTGRARAAQQWGHGGGFCWQRVAE